MKKHIVIVEDDLELLERLQLSLQGKGYLVTALPRLGTIEELLELAPDCYVIDETLPEINGHILCIILKSKLRSKGVPLILISDDENLPGFASLCEADTYLQKPFETDDVLADTLERVLDGGASQA